MIAKGTTVLFYGIKPFLWRRMYHIAKKEVEDGDRIDGVEDISTFVKEQSTPAISMQAREESDQIVIDGVTKEEVQGYTKTPSKYYLIVRVNAVIYAT